MNFSITGTDPRNTQITGPGAAYSVQSPGTIKLQTTIFRAGAAVAQIDRHAFSPDMLRMAGTERRVSEILWRRALFTTCKTRREFAANGQTYTWPPSPSMMTVRIDNDTRAVRQPETRAVLCRHIFARGLMDSESKLSPLYPASLIEPQTAAV
ncbi:hypothetical protein AURDEDRAFT_164956 [Auricularia subglabra TFB-10046 SS5]|nr:hypothetical protein AURDEDRAFT_164956 [Auricularia subglabra TFB-10046 SS5]